MDPLSFHINRNRFHMSSLRLSRGSLSGTELSTDNCFGKFGGLDFFFIVAHDIISDKSHS